MVRWRARLLVRLLVLLLWAHALRAAPCHGGWLLASPEADTPAPHTPTEPEPQRHLHQQLELLQELQQQASQAAPASPAGPAPLPEDSAPPGEQPAAPDHPVLIPESVGPHADTKEDVSNRVIVVPVWNSCPPGQFRDHMQRCRSRWQ